MFEELNSVLLAVPLSGRPENYATAVIEDNCLAKQTIANRRHSLQHLRELYALDVSVPIFRILANLWAIDATSHPLLALLAALARDPLLLATAPLITAMPEGAEFQRSLARTLIDRATGERLNESTVDKIVRNTASSWAQSGHLKGRTFKVRRLVRPTPAAVAFALYLADASGFHAQDALASSWVKVLDCGTSTGMEMALEAKRIGLIDLRSSGNVFELNLGRLDPEGSRR